MIYALIFVLYAAQGNTVTIQSVETRAMFTKQADCEAAALPKRAAFTATQGINVQGAAWRDAQCVAVPVTVGGATIAPGLDGL